MVIINENIYNNTREKRSAFRKLVDKLSPSGLRKIKNTK